MEVKGIDEDVFKLMVHAKAVREVVAVRTEADRGNGQWRSVLGLGTRRLSRCAQGVNRCAPGPASPQ